MRLASPAFADHAPLPAEFAFGRPGDAGEPCVYAANRSPPLAWSDPPAGTRSFALLCVDIDVPTRPDDVNQPDRTVPFDLPRGEFLHWALIDLAADRTTLAAGECGEGVVAGGKRNPPGPAGSRQGRNDYTGWFAGDADMAGEYFGYDGPCPPWNDERVHRYAFTLFALDVDRLELADDFGLAEVRAALQGHVLAAASITGTYALYAEARR